jgi:hypothetical protein
MGSGAGKDSLQGMDMGMGMDMDMDMDMDTDMDIDYVPFQRRTLRRR